MTAVRTPGHDPDLGGERLRRAIALGPRYTLQTSAAPAVPLPGTGTRIPMRALSGLPPTIPAL